MAEYTTNVSVVKVDYRCDVCNQGNMQIAGSIMLLTQPPQFPHVCDKCGHSATYPERYPAVRYRVLSTE